MKIYNSQVISEAKKNKILFRQFIRPKIKQLEILV
jgi:hypothetical protein